MAPMSEQSRQQIRDAFGCKVHLGSGQTNLALFLVCSKTVVKLNCRGITGVFLCSNEQAVINEEGVEVEQGETGEIVWRGHRS